MNWTTEEIIVAIDRIKCANELSTSIRKLRNHLNITERNAGIDGRRPRSSLRSYQQLELTVDFDAPVFAAISGDTHGYGLAIGLGCSFCEESAVNHVFLEIKQLKFAQFIAWKKQTESGSEHLNPGEKSALSRAMKINVRKTGLLWSRRPIRNQDLQKTHFSITDFSLSAKANNNCLYYVDLSSTDKSPFVVKVLSPDLMSPVMGFPHPKLNQYTRQWRASDAARLSVDLLKPLSRDLYQMEWIHP